MPIVEPVRTAGSALGERAWKSLKPGRLIVVVRKKKAAVGKQVDDFHGYVGLRSLLNPIWCFHGFRTAVIILTIFGVIMVFSSSSVNMIANGQSPWSQALKQGGFCVSWTYRGCCLHDDSGGAHQEIQFRLPDYRFAFAVADVYPLGASMSKATKVGSAFLDLPSSPPKSLSLRCAYGCRGN